ncbi:short-chain dehydrogenase [Terrabacter sp. 28]|nr:short-chain dehydrogenase [Terrabacter sp. 28]
MKDFAGLVAVVTGGASGIGAAVVTELAGRGAKVAVLDRDPTGATVSDDVIALVCDVSDDASVRAAVDRTVAQFGGLDIVVNNAGIGAQGAVGDNDDDEWHRVWDVNVVGAVRVTRAALPHLRASAHGAVVNMGSIAATRGLPQRALYSASKGAVHALTRAMAADHMYESVRVNAVAPGTADTPWVARLLATASDPEAERASLNARQPHGRLVSAAEVASAVAYLASPGSGSTNGVCLAVDGGMDNLVPRPPSPNRQS